MIANMLKYVKSFSKFYVCRGMINLGGDKFRLECVDPDRYNYINLWMDVRAYFSTIHATNDFKLTHKDEVLSKTIQIENDKDVLAVFTARKYPSKIVSVFV